MKLAINTHAFALNREVKCFVFVFAISTLNLLIKDSLGWISWANYFLFVVFVGCGSAYLVYKLYYSIAKTYLIEIDDYKVTLTYGRMIKRKIIIQKVKLKHHKIRANFIESKLKVSNLELFTSGSKEADMLIPSLPDEELQLIINNILPDILIDKDVLHDAV